MKRPILSRAAMAVLALAAFGASAAANASGNLYIAVGTPVMTQAPVYVQPPPAYEAPLRYVHARPRPVYVAPPVYAHEGRRACGAPRWDPSLRYMPGQAVVRHGALYVATRISASVWNVNSPPEWTPNYWVQADCT